MIEMPKKKKKLTQSGKKYALGNKNFSDKIGYFHEKNTEKYIIYS